MSDRPVMSLTHTHNGRQAAVSSTRLPLHVSCPPRGDLRAPDGSIEHSEAEARLWWNMSVLMPPWQEPGSPHLATNVSDASLHIGPSWCNPLGKDNSLPTNSNRYPFPEKTPAYRYLAESCSLSALRTRGRRFYLGWRSW